MYNPLLIAGAAARQNTNRPRRRRHQVGIEFRQSVWCASTGQYYDPTRETCPTSGDQPITGTWGPGPTVPTTVPQVPPTTPTATPGIPPRISTVPYNPPDCSSGIPQTCQPPLAVCPENQKRWTLPFVPDTGFTASVAAGATVRFVAFPQGLFIGERLIVPSTIGPYFDILDFRIANKPQTMAAGAVPADMYSEVSTLDTMKYDQAYPGIQVVLTAQNKSSITQIFQCSLSGWAVG